MPELTKEDLASYFSQFGPVSEVIVMTERDSGISRGFGFVTFNDPQTANIVLGRQHSYAGKRLECKRAKPKGIMTDPETDGESQQAKKIFVGGLPEGTTEAEIRETFSPYGTIAEVAVLNDRQTADRLFSFVLFELAESVDEVMRHYYEIKVRGKWVGSSDLG